MGGAQALLRRPAGHDYPRQGDRRRPARSVRMAAASDIMSCVAPVWTGLPGRNAIGNPLAVAAGLAMLTHLKSHPEIYGQLEATSAAIADAAPAGITVNRVGAMFTWFFTGRPVTDWESAKQADTAKFAAFHRRMLEQGIYLPPSQFEAAFVSAAHTEEDVRRTVAAVRAAS